MKTETKKIVLTKKGEISKSVQNMLMNCRFFPNTRQIYTGYYSGSGRFTTAHSALIAVTQILEAQGYKYVVSNDAPQGGIKGENVKISKTAYLFMANLLPEGRFSKQIALKNIQ